MWRVKMSKRKKFNQIWSNQTNLGKRFGLSAIAVGKIFTETGLKDPKTKLATKKALDEGYAKDTPLKDGTPYFMWNIEKVRPLITKDHKPLNKVEYWVNEVLAIGKEANRLADKGQDKLGCIMIDCAFDNVPKNILEEVKEKVKEIELQRK